MHRKLSLVLLAFSAAAMLSAQDAPPAAPQAPTPPTPGAGRGAPPSTEPQPYEKVVTKEAKTKKGIFTVHQIKDKYYYEIPKGEFGKEFLWVASIAKTTNGVGYGGDQLTERVVHWELSGNKVHLRDNNYTVQGDPKAAINQAVEAANNSTIIRTFPVAAFNKAGDPVIEVTQFFSSDIPEFSARQHLNATAVDATRSFVDRISPYPENIEAEATMTFTRAQTPGGAAAAIAVAGGMRPGSATIVLHHSMVKLPEHPMQPRLIDERVGYFTTSHTDYSTEQHKAARITYITRWRLEKKDPNAALSEPVKPLVYYIDSATPEKWRPWMIKAVESWQPAFEAAGFKNAIVAKMAPTPAEDPDWSAEDIRHSVVRWLPSTTENAVGPSIADPRSGEILNADIEFFHNVMNLQRDWYFLQVGPLDPRAQKLPLPDDLMGRLLEFVLAHEVGHTLGFQHNMKASSMYPAEKMHDKDWIHKMGAAPSIMDYARFNYVAQPEDGIPAEDLVPRVGPYDIWAAHWGYAPIPGAKTAEAEKATLDSWSREQDKTPWFRFSTAGAAGADPGENTEAIGDADAIQSTAAGVKNLQRVAKMMLPATTAKPGEPYEDLAEMYGRMLGQWTLEMNHVAVIVGGFDSQTKFTGQEGVLFTPVAKARQEAAVKFLNENAFATPSWMLDDQILRRIEPTGAISRVRNAQSSVMSNLLSSPRFARLVEQEAAGGAKAFAPADFLAAVRKGIWKELDGAQVRIDAYRRNLQHAYLDLANTKVNGSSPSVPAALMALLGGGSSNDEKPMYRAELRSLNAAILAALPKTTDRSTKAHLEAARDQIAKILDPKFAQPAGATGGAVIRIGIDGAEGPDGLDLFSATPDQIKTCWPDYVIRPD